MGPRLDSHLGNKQRKTSNIAYRNIRPLPGRNIAAGHSGRIHVLAGHYGACEASDGAHLSFSSAYIPRPRKPRSFDLTGRLGQYSGRVTFSKTHTASSYESTGTISDAKSVLQELR